ncbi:hypothetical protein N9X82_01280 [Polaribacter sp.]|nr:hypothetical protein [Polaribacter sp.]MDC1375207.1 hypothetical protein [Polaribacter sp.]
MKIEEKELQKGKKNNSLETIQSKRGAWNARRKYNYKCITTIF